jgi:guanylate kinase
MQAPLVILSGPSGVGKTTVVEQLLRMPRKFPLRRAVTATSRDPRSGEVPERDYHFWTAEDFQKKIPAGQMLEHAIVHGTDYYGTPIEEVRPYQAKGTGVLLVIDVQGAAQIRAKTEYEHLSVFLMPPSQEELVERLRGRSTENSASLERRLASAERELSRRNEFDVRLVNDTLVDTVRALAALIDEQFTQRGFR